MGSLKFLGFCIDAGYTKLNRPTYKVCSGETVKCLGVSQASNLVSSHKRKRAGGCSGSSDELATSTEETTTKGEENDIA